MGERMIGISENAVSLVVISDEDGQLFATYGAILDVVPLERRRTASILRSVADELDRAATELGDH